MCRSAVHTAHPARFAVAALLSAPMVLASWEAGALQDKPVFYGRCDRDPVASLAMFDVAEAHLADKSGSAVARHVYRCRRQIDAGQGQDVAA